jgi:hypothetical protein
MRSFKIFGALLAVVALSAIGVANASAAEFTASKTGTLTGTAEEPQVFTTNGGTLTCTTLSVTGEAEKTASPDQEVTVHYSGCTGPFSSPVHVSPATYRFTAGGQVHIENTITIKVTTVFGTCHTTVTPQTVGTVDYETDASGTIRIKPTVEKIAYHSSGLCGSSGTNGTYTGLSKVYLEEGTLQHDP